MTTRVPAIPAPTSDNLLQVANAVKEVIEVREGVRGDPLDKGVTFRDLEALKLVQQKSQAPVLANIDGGLPVQPYPGVAPGAFKPDNYDEASDLNTPPAPTNLTASGAYSIINLSWSYPPYRNHSYTEIYRSATDDLGTAQIIGTSIGNLYGDPVGTEKKYYYWVRNVSMANVKSAFNSTAGTVAETAVDVAARIAAIETDTLNDPLSKELASRITAVENATTYNEDQLSALAASKAALDAELAKNGSGIVTLNKVTKSQATSITSLGTRVGSAESKITNLQTTTATQATQLTTLNSTVSGHSTSIQTLQTTSNGLSAQYTVKIDNNGHVSGFGLASTMVNGTPTSAFIIRADKFAIVDPASTGNSLTVVPNTDSMPFAVVNGGTYIKAAFIQDATITNAKIKDVAADKITAGTITASLDLQAPVVRSGPVLPGQSGFYLGEFNGARRFYVGNGSTGINGRSLEFDGANTIVRGDIYAYNGTIGGCNITGSYIQSTNYGLSGGAQGWRLESNGNLYANAGSFRGDITGASGTFTGSLSATSGTIGGVTIQSNNLRSSNYASGSSGWAISAAGNAEFNNVTVRGDLRSSSLYTGSIIKDTTSGLQIYSVAGMGTVQPYVANTSQPYTNTELRIWGPAYHAYAPINQRCRNTNNGVLLVVTIVATATVDHYFSIWFRYNYYNGWVPLTQVTEPQSGDGSAAITYTALVGLSDNEYIDIGVAALNTGGVFYNSSKPYLRDLTVGVTVTNL